MNDHPDKNVLGTELQTCCKEALEAGVASGVDLIATHSAALKFVSLSDLQQHAISV